MRVGCDHLCSFTDRTARLNSGSSNAYWINAYSETLATPVRPRNDEYSSKLRKLLFSLLAVKRLMSLLTRI